MGQIQGKLVLDRVSGGVRVNRIQVSGVLLFYCIIILPEKIWDQNALQEIKIQSHSDL